MRCSARAQLTKPKRKPQTKTKNENENENEQRERFSFEVFVLGFRWGQPRASLRLALRLQCLGWRLF
jgi:hypothetical protein